MGGAPQQPPSDPGFTQWGGVSPLMSKPFGSYMQFAGSRYNMAGMTPAKPTYEHGGNVIDDSALAHARALLNHAKRASGGSVSHVETPKRGGHKRDPRSPRQLLQLLVASGEHISGDKQFSYALARSPQLRNWFHRALKAGYNREQAKAAIYEALAQLLDEYHERPQPKRRFG